MQTSYQLHKESFKCLFHQKKSCNNKKYVNVMPLMAGWLQSSVTSAIYIANLHYSTKNFPNADSFSFFNLLLLIWLKSI